MKRFIALVFSSALAATALVIAQGQPQQGRPTFTTSTDVVMVDVSVRKGGKQLTGLTAADFDLRDNGVKQQVETVEAMAVPIDLSIVIDVTGNPDRPWVNLPSSSTIAAGVAKRAKEVTALLRPGDRVRLFALNTYVQQIWPLQDADRPPAIDHVEFDGMPSLYDTLLTLLLQPTEPRRRHVIVAETKGADVVSVTSAMELRQIAAHSDAQAHLVMMERKVDDESTVTSCQRMLMDLVPPTYRFWRPANRRLFAASPMPCLMTFITSPGSIPAGDHPLLPDGLVLKEGVDATGGGLYQTVGLSEPTLLNTFEKAFENFRQSYILRYSPKGVARPGWHEITVSVPRDKSVQIKARNGYNVDAPVTTPAVASSLQTGSALVRAYDAGSFDLVTRSLRVLTDPTTVITEFEAGGNPWPAHPQREAALAIEIAEAGLYSPKPAARDQGDALIRRFARLVRHPISPDAFEREWLVTAARMMQGAMRPSVTEPFVDNAIQRFPDDPRLRLARAIVTDQRWPASARTAASADHIASVGAQYDMASSFQETRAEAQVRHGWFLHRIGRDAEALSKIEGASVDQTDRALLYLRELLMGQVLQTLDRSADAIASFKRAVTLAPGAQEARVALMNALIIAGDRDTSMTLATQLQSAPVAIIDPWWMYWQGDYRRYGESLGKLREMMR